LEREIVGSEWLVGLEALEGVSIVVVPQALGWLVLRLEPVLGLVVSQQMEIAA